MGRKAKIMALILATTVMMLSMTVYAKEDAQRIAKAEAGEVFQILTTAYCHGDVTATGAKTRGGYLCCTKGMDRKDCTGLGM